MSREFVKEIYKAKVAKFGTGARIKAYKKHIGQEMVIMTKERFLELVKNKVESKGYKEILDKEFKKIELELSKKQEG